MTIPAAGPIPNRFARRRLYSPQPGAAT